MQNETKSEEPKETVEKQQSLPQIENKQPKQQTKKNPFFFTDEGLPQVIAKKVAGLIKVLNEDVINIERLKHHLSEGIPDEAPIIRQYCWKLILGYLPENKSKWQAVIEKQQNTYEGFVKLFLPEQKFEDYPLNLKKQHPRFKELEEDYNLWEQIQKDTSRTHAEFTFFATASKQIMLPYLTSARRQKFKLINGEDQLSYQQFLQDKEKQRKTYRYDYLTRILYVYSMLNPRIQYVQGMNEILAPIFYIVNINKSANAIEEASCFFMLNNALSDIIELHIKDLDKSKNGIYGKLNQVNQMLVVIEPRVWSRMEVLKIDPFFYCFRWVTLLYAQDFELFDTLRIWESIFSSDDRMQFINFIAISIIISSKQVILENDFTYVLQYLQNIRQNIHVNEVVEIAHGLYYEFKDKDFVEQANKTKKALKKKEKSQQNKQGKGFFGKFNNFVDKYF